MNRRRPLPLSAVCAGLVAVFASAAQAHDSWFAHGPGNTLRLGTGNQFPKHESAIGAEFLRQAACRRPDGGTAPLRALSNDDTALSLQRPTDALACWAQTDGFEVELQPDKIALYLQEVRPPQTLRDAWAGLQARGVPWRERYIKHARIEWPAAGTPQPRDAGMGMDVLLDAAGAPPAVGAALTFQVLRDGKPLPQFAVELRSDATAIGIWRRTDADGRLQFQPPFAGRWLLRGIDLRLSDTVPDTFDSRFVTLAFEVLPRPAAR